MYFQFSLPTFLQNAQSNPAVHMHACCIFIESSFYHEHMPFAQFSELWISCQKSKNVGRYVLGFIWEWVLEERDDKQE